MPTRGFLRLTQILQHKRGGEGRQTSTMWNGKKYGGAGAGVRVDGGGGFLEWKMECGTPGMFRPVRIIEWIWNKKRQTLVLGCGRMCSGMSGETFHSKLSPEASLDGTTGNMNTFPACTHNTLPHWYHPFPPVSYDFCGDQY